MIRTTTNGDISDEEFNTILKPFLDNYDEYIESYVMPEVIAYYIANLYYRNDIYEGIIISNINFILKYFYKKKKYFLFLFY